MPKLSPDQIAEIQRLLRENGELPPEWRWTLFPPQKQEYELVYGGKQREEDILAETMGVPLQTVRTFNNGASRPAPGGWYNRLIFGDNLQAMKSLLDDPDVIGKVKLVYIDPPFATKQEFQGSQDQKAYQDKIAGAEFLEFLRKRLIIIRELLAPEGYLFVHLDQKKSHYIKVILDEVLKENNFVNHVVWSYRRWPSTSKAFQSMHDDILMYAKQIGNPSRFFKVFYENPSESYIKRFGGKTQVLDEETRTRKITVDEPTKGMPMRDVWDLSIIAGSKAERTGYPTQKPEELLARILEACSQPGDLVLDAFAGSGTCAAVSEKLGRRWVAIDSGKLAIYSIQKRLFHLLEGIGHYGKPLTAKPFVLQSAGLYDFESLKELPWKDWRFFALQLFECKDHPQTISGFAVDGEKKGALVLVWNWAKNPDATISEETISDIHAQIGGKIGKKFYIIAPMRSFDFFQDYLDHGGVRYYALRIPYTMIHELHRRDFQAVAQARGAENVNDIQEAYGFSFMLAPEVKWTARIEKTEDFFNSVVLRTTYFHSRAKIKGTEREGGFETLAMLMVDLNYDGKIFDMDQVFYGEEMESQDWAVKFTPESLGARIMVVWIDHHGNEAKVVITREDFGLAALGETTQPAATVAKQKRVKAKPAKGKGRKVSKRK